MIANILYSCVCFFNIRQHIPLIIFCVFISKVDFDSMCVTTSGISSREKKYPTNNGILNTMKSNHKKNPSLLWQYVGFENGILINYPATKLSHCSSYDPRFR